MARDFVTPLKLKHHCALCTIAMPGGTPPLCATCAARPEGRKLLAGPTWCCAGEEKT